MNVASVESTGSRSTKVSRSTSTVENVYFVAYRYGHHAGRSGYDRFADYLGERVTVSPRLGSLGNTLLKLPAKVIESVSGIHEYRRPDAIEELAVLQHMRGRRNGLYHFLYGEKSLYLAARVKGWRGHRVVGSFHHTADSYPNRYRSTKCLRGIDHAIVVSRSQIDFMESIVGAGKVSFVPYAVDADYFVPAVKVNASRPLRCTCVGEHMRDFETLEQVISRVVAAVPQVEFCVIGARPDVEGRLRSLPAVVWKQRIPDAEYLDILQQTDVLVLPLKDSTSVTSVNEALACGVPVVTNEGGVEDYVNDDCSIIHAVGDAGGMANSVIALLRDDSLRQTMSSAARQQGLSLHWPRSAARMAEVYERIRN